MSQALRDTAGDSGRERPSQRKSDRTRRRVLSAAKQLFDKRGYRDTTIDDITRRAEIAHGTFYLYFRSKRAILKELLAQTFEEFDVLTTVDPMGPADVATIVRQSLETYQRNKLLMRLLREASASDTYFREHYDEVFVGLLVDHLQANIARIQASVPGAPKELDPRAAARAIVGMIESFSYGIFVGGEEYSIDTAVATLTRFVTSGIGIDRAQHT